uniref:Major facilitator superfamily (MFS) profile domain-containing protein n=1 Tax=Zooxanthella nutricula TaxID=1333877 RepID=A0A7S2NWA0_9DINO
MQRPAGRQAAAETQNAPVELNPQARLFVFVLFTQVGQALMSYDGGATQMSTKPLLQSGWRSSELGLLGAMDKFGQVATAFVWSGLLMRMNIKFLLSAGLFAKAASCMGFGVLEAKWAMLLSKLGMGVSEALIGVWATVWVQANAPRDSQARWLGFASISAGMGNGVGSAVAGLGSQRFGYAFAFVLQACVLFGLWGIMLFCPGRWFEFADAAVNNADNTPEGKSETDLDGTVQDETLSDPDPLRARLRRRGSSDAQHFLRQELARSMSVDLRRIQSLRDGGDGELIEAGVASDPPKMSLLETFRLVLQSRIWLYTALSISLSCYITSSVAYMWQNTTESVWHFSDSEATYSFLVTTGVGGLLGVSLGPKLFDEYLEGFADAKGKIRCLAWCTRLTWMAVAMGTLAALLFLATAYHLVYYDIARQARGWLLALVLTGVFGVFAFLNSMQGTLYGINTDSATPETKTSAAGLTVSMQNVVGFALGPLLPSVTAELVGNGIHDAWPETDVRVVHSAQFSTGMAASLLALWPLLLSVRHAARAAVAGGTPRDAASVHGSVSQGVADDTVNLLQAARVLEHAGEFEPL